MNGISFYTRDKENMQRFPPPHYGAQKSTGSESARSAKSDNALPEDMQVRHSVLKGLWFPIMNNLTNLIMEKRKDI